MKKSENKSLLFLVIIVTGIYFFISWDVIDMPVKKYEYLHEIPKEEVLPFHSKLFGNIPLIVKDMSESIQDGYMIRPVKGKIWILHVINWMKFLVIGLLGLILSLGLPKNEDNDQGLLFALIATCGIVTLFDIRPCYGISEVFITLLFIGDCLLLLHEEGTDEEFEASFHKPNIMKLKRIS